MPEANFTCEFNPARTARHHHVRKHEIDRSVIGERAKRWPGTARSNNLKAQLPEHVGNERADLIIIFHQ